MKASDLGAIAARVLAGLFFVLGVRGLIGSAVVWSGSPIPQMFKDGTIYVYGGVPLLYLAFSWTLWTTSRSFYDLSDSPSAMDLLHILLRSLGVYFVLTNAPRLIAEVSVYRWSSQYREMYFGRSMAAAIAELCVVLALALGLIFNNSARKMSNARLPIDAGMLSSVLMCSVATYVLLVSAPNLAAEIVTSNQAEYANTRGNNSFELIRDGLACFAAIVLIGFHLINVRAAEDLQASSGGALSDN